MGKPHLLDLRERVVAHVETIRAARAAAPLASHTISRDSIAEPPAVIQFQRSVIGRILAAVLSANACRRARASGCVFTTPAMQASA